MELQGKIKTIHQLEEKGEKKFKTQEITLDRTSEYNGDRKENYSRIQLSGANTDQVLNLQLKEGDVIKCNFDITAITSVTKVVLFFSLNFQLIIYSSPYVL